MNSEESYPAYADTNMSTSAIGGNAPSFDDCIGAVSILFRNDSYDSNGGLEGNDCFSCVSVPSSANAFEPSLGLLDDHLSSPSNELSCSSQSDLGSNDSRVEPSMGPMCSTPIVDFFDGISSLSDDYPLSDPQMDGFSSECLLLPLLPTPLRMNEFSLPDFHSVSDVHSSAPSVDSSASSLAPATVGEDLSQPSESDTDVTDQSQYSFPYRSKRSSRKAKHAWTGAEDYQLTAIVNVVFQLRPTKKKGIWGEVAKRFNAEEEGRNLSAKQCREHYSRITSHHNKNTWQVDENEVIDSYLRKKLTLEEVEARLHRSKKQIKERIRTMLKNNGPWSEAEEREVMSLYRQYGEHYARISDVMWEHGFYRDYQQVKNKVTALLK